MGQAPKGDDPPTVSRLSPLQREILEAMRSRKAYPRGDLIRHLPRTGNIIDAVGRERNPRNIASVSRALARLQRAGLVRIYSEGVRGKRGYSYALEKGSTWIGRPE